MNTKKFYPSAKRFDEGRLYQSPAYLACMENRIQFEETAGWLCGEDISRLLDAYADILSDITEFECRHYFAEGYRLGRASAQG